MAKQQQRTAATETLQAPHASEPRPQGPVDQAIAGYAIAFRLKRAAGAEVDRLSLALKDAAEAFRKAEAESHAAHQQILDAIAVANGI